MKKPTAFQEILTHSHVLFKTNKDKYIGNAHKYSMRPLSLKQIIHKQMFKGQTCYIRQHYEMFEFEEQLIRNSYIHVSVCHF